MASSQETGDKTPDAELRRSERLKKGDTDAYALPLPLHATERKAAKKAVTAKVAEKSTGKAAARASEKTDIFSASTPWKTNGTEDKAQ